MKIQTMPNIENSFTTENRSIKEYYSRTGHGFYIPLYQRDYSWDINNIEQLLEDISKGIERLVDPNVNIEEEIRFLGTIITVSADNVQDVDVQAVPSAVHKVIDGQQRLSTICVFATLLYDSIVEVRNNFDHNNNLSHEIDSLCDTWKRFLKKLYSVDLEIGDPTFKPKIIREDRDKWTLNGNLNDHYVSPVSYYIANFIDKYNRPDRYVQLDPSRLGEKFSKNIISIRKWLNEVVKVAHVSNSEDFTPANLIIDRSGLIKDILVYDRSSFLQTLKEPNILDSSDGSNFYSLIQILSVCHYLLDRCCFTIIKPLKDDWAFDMFQSLNATGTPLTAIETFKPLVVNITRSQGIEYNGSNNEQSMTKVEDLFVNSDTAAQKSKLTNEFLTSFFVALKGEKLSSHFSHQRKELETYLNRFPNFNEKQEFFKFFGDYAEFYKLLRDYIGQGSIPFPKIAGADEAELASMLILFLKDSGHKMSITILAYFYKDVINNVPNSVQSFVEAVKTVSAFYIFWRSSRANAGLDNVYRDFFKAANGSWDQRRSLTNQELKRYLLNKLSIKDNAHSKDFWIAKAKTKLRYDNVYVVCRLALFITAHDTIVDEASPGLMKIGRKGTSTYLTVKKWVGEDYKSIEHIAPKTSMQNGWDTSLYDNDNLVESIGNLTLLPIEINSIASNRGWTEKYLYYRHLGENDNIRLEELEGLATELQITLNKEKLEKLRKSTYSPHILSIISMPSNGNWDREHVEKRRDRILEVLWERLSEWLN